MFFRLLRLGVGAQSIRVRPNLNVTAQDIERFIAMLARCLNRLDL